MPPFSTARISLEPVPTVRTVGYKYAVGFTDFRNEDYQHSRKRVIWYSFDSNGRKQKHVHDANRVGISISRKGNNPLRLCRLVQTCFVFGGFYFGIFGGSGS